MSVPRTRIEFDEEKMKSKMSKRELRYYSMIRGIEEGEGWADTPEGNFMWGIIVIILGVLLISVAFGIYSYGNHLGGIALAFVSVFIFLIAVGFFYQVPKQKKEEMERDKKMRPIIERFVQERNRSQLPLPEHLSDLFKFMQYEHERDKKIQDAQQPTYQPFPHRPFYQPMPPHPSSQPESYQCATCGYSLRYIPQYQRWFCDHCYKYI